MMRTRVFLACVALVLACGRAEHDGSGATGDAAPASADPEGRLDSSRYRLKIEAAEALLYSPEGLSEEGWKALSTAFLELHNEIVFTEASAPARETSARLFFLSARADAMTTGQRTEVELAQLRELWLALCSERFTPADWIRAEAPSP